jgi:hypothetical protein
MEARCSRSKDLANPQRQPSQAGWKDLFQDLARIDRGGLAKVALEPVDESGKPRDGSDTARLEVLETNSEVLIDLAFHVQQWDAEALVIVERLRLDNRELKG